MGSSELQVVEAARNQKAEWQSSHAYIHACVSKHGNSDMVIAAMLRCDQCTLNYISCTKAVARAAVDMEDVHE